ncbi:MAG: DUF4097 family beta strand repeat protein [Candidatus Latescibacteria bacterium]|nr:DUF4097 family beta strand repeat protein [Candidatus Latescibacterota bacterium]
MKRKLTIYLSAILIPFTFLLSEAFSDAREEFHRTYNVKSGTEVEFANRNGKVDIRSWDKDYVDVYALKRTKRNQDELDLVTIEVNNNGVLEIKTVFEKYPEKDTFFKRLFGWRHQTSPEVTVDYTIKLPTTVLLSKALIRNGSIEIDGTRGDTIVRSRNGSIIINNVDQCIEAEARNGNISITSGTVIGKVKTRNGNITINNGTGMENVQTRNGSIEVSLLDKRFGNTCFSTRNGSVVLYLSPDMNAGIELQTRDGKITTEGISLMLDKITKKHIVGTLGSGGNAISVKTRNGRISLRQD